MSREDKKGWVASLIAHLLIAAFLFFWPVEQMRTEPEFLEVSWGRFSNVPIRPAPASPPSSGVAVKRNPESRIPVDLPKRSPGVFEDDPPLPPAKRSITDENYKPSGKILANRVSGQKDEGIGSAEKHLTGEMSGLGESGKQSGPSLTGGDGSDVGKSVAYSMQWGDGGTRKLLRGDLPEYPSGVNVEAQIKLEALVTPSGRVRALRPIQKGNTRLESAAIGQVRDWLFEPLGGSAPQQDQICVITFNFVLN